MSDWITVTWAEVMAGDTVRVLNRPESVSTVESVDVPPGLIGIAKRDTYGEKQRMECVRLAGRTGILRFAPTDEIELLVDEALTERRVRAVLASFSTSRPIG